MDTISTQLKSTMNWGVCVRGSNSDDVASSYYGHLNKVLVLTYHTAGLTASVILFQCDWFDPSPRGTNVHQKYNLVDINMQRKYPNYDPFVLAQQVIQVYYCRFPAAPRSRSNWIAVCETKSRRVLQPLPTDHESVDDDAPYQMTQIQETPIITASTERIELCDMDGINLMVDLGDLQHVQHEDSKEEFDDEYVTSTDDDDGTQYEANDDDDDAGYNPNEY